MLERVQEKDRQSCLIFDEVVKICQECGMPSMSGASVDRPYGIWSYSILSTTRLIPLLLQKARKKEHRLLTKLQEKGILDPKLLDIVWEDRRQEIDDLTRLLVKFDFFVPLLRQVEATDTNASEGGLYLVPAILPKRLTMHQSTTTPKTVGYLFFALSDIMEGIRKKGYVTVDEVKRDSFFSMGLGPAVTGQIVSEYNARTPSQHGT